MTPADIKLVQASFSQVIPIADQAATMFYDRLFTIAPEVKPLFKGDAATQRRVLMATLGAVVGGLNNLDAILPTASALAKRHVNYGVKADHHGPVGEALLWTLQTGLGPAWNPQLETAWTEAYTTLSNYMISEAYKVASRVV
jgi:hemoglobin-like flavoprotein